MPTKKKNSGDQEIQALIPRKIQLLQWFFPRKFLKNPTTAQHAPYHHMFITCRTTEQFTVIFWQSGGLKLLFLLLLKWDLPQIRSIPVTNLQHNPWAKWSFPIFFPPKNTPPKSFEHFQPAGNAADPPIGWTVSRCQYLCTWKVFLPNFTKWLQ